MSINDSDGLGGFGYCADCHGVHSLPFARAIPHCHQLMTQLKNHRRMDFNVPDNRADPRFSTDMLYGDSRGKMFGVLVCENLSGQEVILRAFSCQHNGIWHMEGWVPPIVDTARFDSIASEASVEIHRLNEIVDSLPVGVLERDEFVSRRRAGSKKMVADLRELYILKNFRGKNRSLADAFVGRHGIPWGTGDCCAPKLLQEAALRELRPKAMAEFFWGRSNSSGTREEGIFYPSCEERCQPILGFMLCGGTDV